MPRSGSTWVSQLLAAHPAVRMKFCPLFSYEFKDRCDATSSPAEWRTLFEEVYRTPGEFLDQEHLRQHGHVPSFDQREPEPPVLAIKSNRYHHLTPSIFEALPEARWIAVVRDPVRTIASWVQAPTEFPEACSLAKDWRSGACRKQSQGEFWGFDDWLQVTRMHLELAEREPERFVLVPYDDIAQRPTEACERVLSAAGLDAHPQALAFARESQANHDGHKRSIFKDPKRSKAHYGALPKELVEVMVDESRSAGLARFLSPDDGA